MRTAESIHKNHRRDIDGLRSLAIVPVLLFHMGVAFVPGGFLGVDVFFVISGFLITGILYKELQATGKFSIGNFYERRVRRIFPALVTVSTVTIIVGYFVLLPDAFKTLKVSLRWVFGFLSNIFFAGQNSYFAPDIDLNPMLHTWSLAIEEQFYVVFPLLLWVLYKFVPKKAWAYVLGAIALASIFWAQANYFVDPTANFYQIQFRAWELLAGGLVALFMDSLQKVAKGNNILSASGLLMLCGSYLFLDDKFAHPGFLTLLPVLGTALIIAFTAEGSITHRLLSLRPIVFIGLISYSLYLWHQPIFAFVRILSPNALSSIELLPALALTLLISILTWKFVENPFRNRSAFSVRKTLLTLGTATTAVLALTVLIRQPALNSVELKVTQNTTVSAEELKTRLSPNYGLGRICMDFLKNQEKCTSGSGTPTVALWGDSFGMHFVQALQSSKTQATFITQTKSTCAPIIGFAPKLSNSSIEWAAQCNAVNSKFKKYLLVSGIKTVVLASNWSNSIGTDRVLVDTKGHRHSAGNIAVRALQKNIADLKSAGLRVVVLLNPPTNGKDLGACLESSIAYGYPLSGCNFNKEDSLVIKVNEVVRSYSSSADLIFDPASVICPSGKCLASSGDVLIYRDIFHISREGSAYLGKKFNLMKTILASAK